MVSRSNSFPGAWLVALALAACGGEGEDDGGGDGSGSAFGSFDSDTSCGVAFSSSGAVKQRLAPSSTSTACFSQTTFDSDLDFGFVVAPREMTIGVKVAEVLEGETGSFPAELTLAHEDGRTWFGTCIAVITEHEHIGPGDFTWEKYLVKGRLECEEPALDPGGSSPQLVVEDFSFVVQVSWG